VSISEHIVAGTDFERELTIETFKDWRLAIDTDVPAQ